jgi:hypothetical protein
MNAHAAKICVAFVDLRQGVSFTVKVGEGKIWSSWSAVFIAIAVTAVQWGSATTGESAIVSARTGVLYTCVTL